ncbi:S24 family peptidase [Sphingomonas sp. SUN019]|uniref:S24 family peptidase n=1 Tax=Sphingomonas sp. SUN019 TaxID=2937788 RepID=UPI00216452FF|nr:S24 family peptidase [Sphingomonas sp. SUN019]UVO51912.1 S24 family peptidase [Sphingomonas sp. SUN019]
MTEAVGQAVAGLAAARGVTLSELSRMLGRNVAYLQQFVRRGTPKRLDERDRRLLAQFFGVGEEMLGAPDPSPSDVAAIPYLSVAASAGGGAAVDREEVVRVEQLSREMLAGAGVAAGQASLIDVRGDSMAPGILDGDRLLVDRADARVSRGGGVFVIRIDGDLSVKRVVPIGREVEIVSDNPAYPPVRRDAGDVDVIGRVKLLLRVP